MNENETNEPWAKRPEDAPADPVTPMHDATPAEPTASVDPPAGTAPVEPPAATPAGPLATPAMPTAVPSSGGGWRPPAGGDSTLTGWSSEPTAATPSGPMGPTPPGPASGAPSYPPAPSYPLPAYDQTHSYPTYPPTSAPGYPTQPVPAVAPVAEHRGGRRFGYGALAAMLVLGTLAGGLVGGLVAKNVAGDNGNKVRVVNGQVIDSAPTIDRSSLASIAAAVRPSVVSIQTSNAEGSGVVLSDDGYVLTNNHVAVTANGSPVQITFDDGTTVKADLVGTDPKTDLAVFKASSLPKKPLTPAKFGNSAALQVGDTVLAIGSPLGLSGSVTEGIVSALNRTIDESSNSQPQDPFGNGQQTQSQPGATIAGAIQTDAAINPGNSGGALVNMSGEVVGINTAIATSSNGSDGNIGVGFAIPSNRAKEVADDLIKGNKVSHPYLGIGVVTADGNGGALVKSVTAGSPAATAGMQEGDVVTAYNGQPVHTSEDLINFVQADKVNNAATLTVTRGTDQNVQVKITLGESK